MFFDAGDDEEKMRLLVEEQKKGFRRFAREVVKNLNKTNMTMPDILKEIGDTVGFALHKTGKDLNSGAEQIIRHIEDGNIDPKQAIVGVAISIAQAAKSMSECFDEIANELIKNETAAMSQLEKIMSAKPPTDTKQ